MSVNEQTSRQVDKLLPILINVIIKILSCKSKQLVYSSARLCRLLQQELVNYQHAKGMQNLNK